VDRLVLTCPGPVFPVRSELGKAVAPDSFHLRRPLYTNAQGIAETNNIRSKAMNFFASSFGWKLASDVEADAFATFGGYKVDRSTVCDTANIPRMVAGAGYYSGVRTYKSLMETRDYRDALKKLETPVLVLKGQCDNQLWGYTFEYMQLFKHIELKVIPSAGHFLWMEQPVPSRTAIRNFLLGDSIKNEQK
jgi:proline iminopeptidase